MSKLLTWAAKEVRRNGRSLVLVGMSTLAVSASLRALQVKKTWEPQVVAKQMELDHANELLRRERARGARLEAAAAAEFEWLEKEVGSRGAQKVRAARERVEGAAAGEGAAPAGEAVAGNEEPAMGSI